MERQYEIYRGERLLGFVGFDDEWPCEPFEPAAAYFEIEHLFSQEHSLSMQAADLADEDEVDRLLSEAENVMEKILAPGVHFKPLKKILCSFQCDQLCISDGRVCWR